MIILFEIDFYKLILLIIYLLIFINLVSRWCILPQPLSDGGNVVCEPEQGPEDEDEAEEVADQHKHELQAGQDHVLGQGHVQRIQALRENDDWPWTGQMYHR